MDAEQTKPYTVYILRCADGSLYTGITTDLVHRTAVHNSGKGGKYTRSHRPVEPVYWESAPDKSAALRRELAIKTLQRSEKLALVETFTGIWKPEEKAEGGE